MALAWGAITNSGNANNQNSHSFNSPNVSGTDTIALVAVVAYDATTGDRADPTAVTWNALGMTKWPSAAVDNDTGDLHVTWWYRIAPTAGVTTVAVTLAGTCTRSASYAMFLNGADQSDPIDNQNINSGSGGTNIETTVNTNLANSMVLDAIMINVASASLVIAGTGDSRGTIAHATTLISGVASRTTTTTGTYDRDWTTPSSTQFVHSLVAVNEVQAAGGAPNVTKRLLMGVGN